MDPHLDLSRQLCKCAPKDAYVLCEETAAASRGFHQREHCKFCQTMLARTWHKQVSAMAVSSSPVSQLDTPSNSRPLIEPVTPQWCKWPGLNPSYSLYIPPISSAFFQLGQVHASFFVPALSVCSHPAWHGGGVAFLQSRV